MKLAKRRREGYFVLNNDYHSPPHTEKQPIPSKKTPISPEISPDQPLVPENVFGWYKCTQCPPKGIRQDMRNLATDIRSQLRHTLLRLQGRSSDLKTPQMPDDASTFTLSGAPYRGSSHAATCPRLLAARSLPNSSFVTSKDRYDALQHFAEVEKIKNEMEKEKKRIGRLRWSYWKWMDGKQGTRLAEERLGERVEVRREEEGGRKNF